MLLRDAVETTGARFLVMLVPSKEELYADRGAGAGRNLADRIAARLVTWVCRCSICIRCFAKSESSARRS